VEIYLVRHAIAADRDAVRWPDDSRRPLTKEGAARFRIAARGLSVLVPSVERVLSSPYPRAWQTAEILREEVRWPEPEPCSELAAVAMPAEVVPVIERMASSVALVGHEPMLSMLASLLLTGDAAGASLELKKGGVVFLESGASGGARLRWSASPKILRRLAAKAG
jgi:phosphohistidine phosphatase